MRLIDQEIFNDFRGIALKDSNAERRFRAHIAVLYEKGFSGDSIESIFERPKDVIFIYLQYLEYFGGVKYFDLSYEEIYKKVSDEYYRRELLKARQNKKSILYYLTWPIHRIFYTILNWSKILLALLAIPFSWLYGKRVKNQSQGEYSNTAKFEKGASNNFLLQINKLEINLETNKEEDFIERLVLESERELGEKIEEIIRSKKRITFHDNVVDSLIEKGHQIFNSDKKSETDKNRDIQLIVLFVVAYLVYSSSIKGGLWTITVIGITIVVSFRSCIPNYNQYPNQPPTNSLEDTTLIQSYEPINSQQEIDSVKAKISNNDSVQIFDYDVYNLLVGDFFEEDNTCFALSAVGQRQKKFIQEYDHVNHFTKPYFISENDDKYYLHVVAYDDIREAAFQMHYLNKQNNFKSRILEVRKYNSVLYAIVIKDFEGNEIPIICEDIEEWRNLCLSSEIELGIIYNGVEI